MAKQYTGGIDAYNGYYHNNIYQPNSFRKSISDSNAMNIIKVFLVDDHQVFLDGLSLLLRSIGGIEIVGMANNGATACEQLRTLDVDIVIMDINMPVMDGIAATYNLRRETPGQRILLLSMHTRPDIIRRALRAGANGYMLKNSGGIEFATALTAIAHGETYLCPNATTAVVEALPNAPPPVDITPLTAREIEIVKRIVQECSNAEIAEQLNINIRTVESHRHNIMQKLSIKSTIALVKYAIGQGWV